MDEGLRERLRAPFAVRGGEESFWVQDARGVCFGFCYFQVTSQIGASGERMNRVLALRTVRWIARQATAWSTAAR